MGNDAVDAEIDLRFVRGVGPARAALLAQAGLRSPADVVHRLPRVLGPPPPLIGAGPLPPGAAVRVVARVVRARPQFAGRRGAGLGLDAILARADGGPVRARFFNAGWLRRHLLPGEWFLWEGKTDHTGQLLQPSFTHLPGGAATPLPSEPACRVAYRLPEGLGERPWRALVAACLDHPSVVDPAGELPPAEYRALLARAHRPADPADLTAVRRALAWRECLSLAWLMQTRRAAVTAAPGRAWSWSDDVHERALARLPFALTLGQQGALAEIRSDLRSATPMYRLLVGDVGSGKTALALLAGLAVTAEHGQTLLLAPTAILAAQHHRFLLRCLAGTRVVVGLLTGGTPTPERTRVLAALAEGSLHLLVGTHALLEEAVRPRALGLVVIDEQHRFGVQQRAALPARVRGSQAWQPHLLLMSATPIPRTLALTAFGDLAVSTIAGRPPGRAGITTHLRPLGPPAALQRDLEACLAAGGRAYVICPRKEEDASGGEIPDAASVVAALRALLGKERVALLTGDLDEPAKLAAMQAFGEGVCPVLVATTVVEVGVDVPTATLMAVLDAGRFGLSQLHQLRGRLGRGSAPGLCLLCHRAAPGSDAERRLEVLVGSDDGLAIAEADLRERGPGALLGEAQHGVLDLAMADPIADLDLFQQAHAQVRAASAAGASMPLGLMALLPGEADVLAGG